MKSTPSPLRSCRPTRLRQRGVSLIAVLLSLVILGLIALVQLEGTTQKQRNDVGFGEATVMQNLSAATNNLIFEHFAAIQSGSPIVKSGVTITPVPVAGELTWQPTIADLRAMGYISAGWTSTTSAATDGAYAIRFARLPVGCVGAACNIEGVVLNSAPVLADYQVGTSDARVIGPFLSTVGADAGVSLPGSAGTVTGYNSTWSTPNPTPGAPAGILAIRVGSGSAGWGQFVRIGDTRDPTLAGNLSVAGNGSIGGSMAVAGPATFSGPVALSNAPLALNDAGGATCVQMLPNGTINVLCAGLVNARQGQFTDGAGNLSQITPTGIVTTGRVIATDGFEGAGGSSVFTAADPNAITVAAGDVLIRNASGVLVRATADGDLVATKNVAGQRVSFQSSVVEGDACAGTSSASATGQEVAGLVGGGLAICRAGRWVGVVRSITLGTACAVEGQAGTDDATGQATTCRRGRWVSSRQLQSNYWLANTVAAQNDDVLAKPICPSDGGEAVVPLIILGAAADEIPYNVATGSLEAINRYAADEGANWRVKLENASGAPLLTARAIAHLYCWYPALGIP